jgi:hypothetical protein
MEPRLDKLLEKIKPDSIITDAEARYLKEINNMQLKGDASYLWHFNKYCDAKLCRNTKE